MRETEGKGGEKTQKERLKEKVQGKIRRKDNSEITVRERIKQKKEKIEDKS